MVISLLTLNTPVSLSACESNTSWHVVYAMNLFSGLSVCLRKGGSVGLFVNRVYQFAERTELFIISYFQLMDDVVMPLAFRGTQIALDYSLNHCVVINVLSVNTLLLFSFRPNI